MILCSHKQGPWIPLCDCKRAELDARPPCDCAGPMTQTVHLSNPEGHQVGCPRWGAFS